MTPYLIQRGKIRIDENRKGLDKLVAFDYMGSSEFEFGALPKSLREIRTNLKLYQPKMMHIPNVSGVTIFAKNIAETLEAIKGVSKRKFALKEHCDFYDWCEPSYIFASEKENRNDFWWDIGNNFMWWLSNPHDEQILQAIRGEK